jgi:hypothetical protein
LRQCMECLGGVGYCENNEDGGLMNIAKIYHDNLVNPIWEGTVSVMAEDLVHLLVDKRLGNGDVLLNVFAPWAKDILKICSTVFGMQANIIEKRLQVLVDLVRAAEKEELLYRGRQLLDHVEVIVGSVAFMYDATINPEPVVEEMAMRWVQSKVLRPNVATAQRIWMETVKLDKNIFLGEESASKQSKL